MVHAVMCGVVVAYDEEEEKDTIGGGDDEQRHEPRDPVPPPVQPGPAAGHPIHPALLSEQKPPVCEEGEKEKCTVEDGVDYRFCHHRVEGWVGVGFIIIHVVSMHYNIQSTGIKHTKYQILNMFSKLLSLETLIILIIQSQCSQCFSIWCLPVQIFQPYDPDFNLFPFFLLTIYSCCYLLFQIIKFIHS